jgi:heptosyltransferase-2
VNPLSDKVQDTAEELRILVLRYSSLGDVALTLPALDELSSHYPKARLFYATKSAYASVVKYHPAVERVLTLPGSGAFAFWDHLSEIKKLRPHAVLDLHDSLRTHLLKWFLRKMKIQKWVTYDRESKQRRRLVNHKTKEPVPHVVERYVKALRGLGIQAAGPYPLIVPVPKSTTSFIKNFCELKGLKTSESVVALAPGSKWFTKQWPPRYWSGLADRLTEGYGAVIWWFGSPEERSEIEAIQSRMTVATSKRGLNLAGEGDLLQTIQLLGHCDLFVGNDSGLTHIAVGRGCRVVAIFGSTTPSLGFAPWGPHNTIVENASLPCRPCHVHGRHSCPLGHFKCMEDLTVDLVEGAVARAIKRSR